jgi:Flp pilus assembly protein TadD
MHALGIVRVKLGDLDGAERAYREGLSVDPEAAENQLGLATVAVVRGDAAAALAAYDALLVKRPRFGAAELGRAWALAKLGRVAEARRAVDHAEALGASADSVAKQRASLVGRAP